jgi:hypothetical protein
MLERLQGEPNEHKKEAEEHHRLAAQHRAASQALLDAEKSACANISDEDRDVSPFSRTTDIVSVSQLHDKLAVGKSTQTRESGATVVFRAAPGLTATGNGFAVDVRSDNAEGAAEIWRRAQALKAAG